ncbi:1-acylglycerol-3-phosphate O-acyltransferase [Chytridiales sp. JEL 0842]|nr:1-acylglycerol-3-phosphate O-acyltransferase [Chytridiales sp. JEL 0842]
MLSTTPTPQSPSSSPPSPTKQPVKESADSKDKKMLQKQRATAAAKEEKEAIAKLEMPLNVQKRPSDLPLYLLRTVLYANALAMASSFAAFTAVFLSAIGQGAQSNDWAAWYMKTFGSVLGIHAEVEGKEYLRGERPCVFVCNHQNVLDLYCFGHIFPPSTLVMAKKEMKYTPFIGQYLVMGSNIFIDRENRESAMKTMQYVAGELKRKKMGIFIFPEGTRSRQSVNDMLPFKKGAFHLAIQGQIPIVPIVISTYGRLYNSKAQLFRGGKLKIKVLPPIDTKGMQMSQIQELSDSVRAKMLATLREISRPVAKL